MKIAILTGGETGEREVSVRSARNIQNLIDFAEVSSFVFPEDVEKFIQTAKEFDLAIPVIHGVGAEDGSVQGLLKYLNIPYIFSHITTHAIAIDKKFTKEIAAVVGIESPKESDEFPIFAKPRLGGSSVSSKLCENEEDLTELLNENLKTEFLVEEPIRGREFTVGILEYQGDVITLPVVEIIPKGEFFDFENKYDPNKLATEICPAEIESPLAEEMQRQALLMHEHLQARHVTRSDFIVTDNKEIYFLEINTIPGMTDTSLIPKMIQAAGLSLKEIIEDWCTKA